MDRCSFARMVRERMLRLDGATGTELAKQGMPPGVCPEKWVTENPQALCAVQGAYVDAGSNIVYAPTFGANPFKLAEFGLEDKCREMNAVLVGISRDAVAGKALVFGDIAPTGQLIEPFGELPFEECVSAYKIQVAGLLEGGADGFAIETMMDLQECRAALLAVRELAPDLPVIVTMTFDDSGRTLTGCDPVSALICLQALGADAFGCDCSVGPEAMAQVIERLKPYAKIPLVAKPNAGLPRLEGDRTVFDLDPAGFGAAAKLLTAAGAAILGGCCGTTPAHIAELDKALGDAPGVIFTGVNGMVSSSGAYRRIAPGEPFAVIGERINPTGKKALQAELRSGSLEMVRSFAREQMESGADLLDVNLGLSGIDEAAMMRRCVAELSVLAPGMPLAIDTTSPEAAEAALRLYPGRALFNSISGEKKKLEEILPIVKRYGALPILLPLTDEGIPASGEERIAVLEKLVSDADLEDYLVDALVMTVGADLNAPCAAMEVIEYANDKLERGTTCGLSNVSFGLPGRPGVNSAFLALAAGKGLSSAIANPCAAGIMSTVAGVDALLGRDPKFSRLTTFAAAAGNGAAPAAAPGKKELSLFDAVLAGEEDLALAGVRKLVEEGMEPLKIVDEILIPAVNAVGEKFEKKEYFLPQLMFGAAAMRKAMDHLKPMLLKSQTGRSAGPVFVMATVEGDIHDIGKNIVTLLLENYGFTVIDLGKDVPCDVVLKTAVEKKAAFIGLSALMTTTMPRMREMAELLKKESFNVPLFVGGAAVDKEFADSIGAYYSPDAMGTVRMALEMVK
ncbi:MAG: homocysteine S-methyltransferase family protein [Lentisphaeria bacterium]|nr:homocysteine S-methyltransferase family protein [Lentisphaeria bacterium]